jgi:hypothetical protein
MTVHFVDSIPEVLDTAFDDLPRASRLPLAAPAG